ncbi:MAG: TerB family tellurite resistance protein [Pseudomonadota bacterium]
MGFIAFITAVAGLLWAINALQRSGFDFRSLNPFAWLRRREWEQRYRTSPLHNLQDPVDVAGVLLLGVARCDGEISSQQKALVLELFGKELQLDRDAAADLLRASAHLIRNEVYLLDTLDRILQPSAGRFTAAQMATLLNMMTRVANCDGAMNAEQRQLIDGVQAFFNRQARSAGTWG